MARIAVPFAPAWPETPADRMRWGSALVVSLIFAGTAFCGIWSVLFQDAHAAVPLTWAGAALGTITVSFAAFFGTIPANSYGLRRAQIRYFSNLCFAYAYAMLLLLTAMCELAEYVPQTHLILPEIFGLGALTLPAIIVGLVYSAPWID